MQFVTGYKEVIQKIHQVDPVKYGSSRNYTNGAVTYLSPYISRGVISTRQVLETVLSKGYTPPSIEKFIQELAWRDYWQQIWIARRSQIDEDLKLPQPFAIHKGMPVALLQHHTGITAIDDGITTLYETGYLHNHLRMYIASLACNIAHCHWKVPAQWMYYHLLDADWASNALSWQWVCGANSQKLYYANQENINKYCQTHQQGTFLAIGYDLLPQIEVPELLHTTTVPELITALPKTEPPLLQPDLPTLVYNFYNLDPLWRSEQAANKILLLEPSVFEKYPVSKKSIDFTISLATQNIPNVQIWVAEFAELQALVNGEIYFKEHPLNNYSGKEDQRSWLTSVRGEYPSFFAYWKKCKKEIF